VHPILFATEGLTISSYGALLNLGLIAALATTWIQVRRSALPSTLAIDVALAALSAGLVGARIGYIATHWLYFSRHTDEIWQIWLGGLSWHGGLIGATVGVWLAARIWLTQTPARWLDVLAPGAALGTVFGWIGCFLSACAYGRGVFPGDPLFTLAIDAPDIYGVWAPRLPSQLAGAAWGLLVFGIVSWEGSRRVEGLRFGLFAAFYSLGSFVVGFSRADLPAAIGSVSIEQALDISVFAASAVGLLIVMTTRSRTHRP
jgi:phosphatidylglycerol:prolipoprotein diacylglycerol transferase